MRRLDSYSGVVAMVLLAACESAHGPVPEEVVQPLYRLFHECDALRGQDLVESDLPDGPEIGLHTNAMTRHGIVAEVSGDLTVEFVNGIRLDARHEYLYGAEATHVLGGTISWGPPTARRTACIAWPGSAFHQSGIQGAAVLRINGGGADCREPLTGTVLLCAWVKPQDD